MSKRAYFGTDGIRGQANRHPMTAEVALRVGLAAGKLFMSKDDRRHLVVIGKDTRLSGYMIETALVAGFTSVGMDVLLTGPIPTPGVGSGPKRRTSIPTLVKPATSAGSIM